MGGVRRAASGMCGLRACGGGRVIGYLRPAGEDALPRERVEGLDAGALRERCAHDVVVREAPVRLRARRDARHARRAVAQQQRDARAQTLRLEPQGEEEPLVDCTPLAGVGRGSGVGGRGAGPG